MRLNRGCGCLVFVLAVINLLYTVSAIVNIFWDTPVTEVSTPLLVVGVGIFASNTAICVLFALRTLRRPDGETDAPVEEWTDDDRPD